MLSNSCFENQEVTAVCTSLSECNTNEGGHCTFHIPFLGGKYQWRSIALVVMKCISLSTWEQQVQLLCLTSTREPEFEAVAWLRDDEFVDCWARKREMLSRTTWSKVSSHLGDEVIRVHAAAAIIVKMVEARTFHLDRACCLLKSDTIERVDCPRRWISWV